MAACDVCGRDRLRPTESAGRAWRQTTGDSWCLGRDSQNVSKIMKFNVNFSIFPLPYPQSSPRPNGSIHPHHPAPTRLDAFTGDVCQRSSQTS